MDQLDRAIADYGKVIALMPADARGWRNRGLVRLFKGDNAGGIADYDKAIGIDPSDAFSWNNRGQAKLRKGDRKGAIADFRKTLELLPDLAQPRRMLRELGVKI
jgi:tetratricopeptide (TPR) repeat protein